MNTYKPRRRSAVVAAGATVGALCGSMLIAGPATAATPKHEGPLLTITGDSTNDSLTVGRTPAGVLTLNGTPVLGGTATTSNVLDIVMDGGAGNDTLRVDESNGAMPRLEFHGGAGNDQLVGGSRADSLFGGPDADALVGNGGDDNLVGETGNDKVVGGPGVDTVSLGAGGDEFTWSSGDGNDVVDGDADKDTLIFNAGPESLINLFGEGPRTILHFPPDPFAPPGTPPRLELSVNGFELMKVNVADFVSREVRVNDMPDAAYAVVRVNFAPYTGPGTGFDEVLYRGTVGPDHIRLAGTSASGVTVFGGAETVLFDHANALTVFGGDGDDVIDANGLAGGVVRLSEFGGGNPFIPTHLSDGDDTLIGTPGDDQLFGGTGSNRIDGRGGNDLILGD
jgi:Ca2+-binding RTX toxin-like protein